MSADAKACGEAAAYVLGALPSHERADFEAHLAQCPDCRDTVADLAGIPGLLSRLTPADLAGPPPVPETVLPRLLREVRHRTRSRRLAMLAGAVAAALVAVTGVGIALSSGPGRTPPGAAMVQLVSAPIRATAALTAEGHGTRIDMTCSYVGGGYHALPSYDLVVVGRDGSTQQVARWRVGPDGTTRVVASVDLAPGRIAAVEVRTSGGTPVLRLSPPASTP